jgi:LuxR family maltose regulon positive regulatory protein
LSRPLHVASFAAAHVSQPTIDPLTERELEVLRLIADGLSNYEIAVRLFVGVSTVKTHVNRIFSKLCAKNRTQAVARARELRLL